MRRISFDKSIVANPDKFVERLHASLDEIHQQMSLFQQTASDVDTIIRQVAPTVYAGSRGLGDIRFGLTPTGVVPGDYTNSDITVDVYGRITEIASSTAPPTHNLLSVSHPDTLPASVVRGDLIVGNSTPQWSRFPIGTADQFVGVNAAGTDHEYKSFVEGAFIDIDHTAGAVTISAITSLMGFWRFDTDTTATDPGSGDIKYNNATPSLVTTIYISQTTNGGTDAEHYLAQIKTGDGIYIQQRADSTRWSRWVVSATPTDNGAWWTIPVTYDSSSGILPQNNAEQIVQFTIGGTGVGVDHGLLSGLTDDDHPQYLLLAGRSGGQTAYGGIAAGEDLHLRSTAHATKGNIFFGAAGTSTYDEVNERWGLGTASPLATFHAVGSHRISSTEIDATNTFTVLAASQYDKSGEPEGWTLIHARSDITTNTLRIGGSSAGFNAATQIDFWTAADVNTRTGSSRVFINAGGLGVGTQTFGASAANVFAIANGTAPGVLANVTQLYSADRGGVGGKAGLHIVSEDGTGHVLSDLVGHGTITPAARLHVDSSTSADPMFEISRTSTLDGIRILNFNGGTGSFTLQRSVDLAAWTDVISLHETGFVGFGTATTPDTLVHIEGGAGGADIMHLERSSGVQVDFFFSGSGGDASLRMTTTGNTFAIGVDGNDFKISDNTLVGTNDRLTIDSTGNIGFGTNTHDAYLRASFTTTLDNFFYSSGSITSTSTSSHRWYYAEASFNPGGASLGSIVGFVFISNVTGSALTIATANGFQHRFDLESGFSGTLTTASNFRASNATIVAGSITTLIGFHSEDLTTGTTNNWGFRGALSVSGTAKWNLYMDGTAPNYLEGNLSIGSASVPASATQALSIFTGTAPTASVTGGVVLYSATRTTGSVDGLVVRPESGQQYIFTERSGFGTLDPTYLNTFYRDTADTDAQVAIEQDGTGDATLAFVLTGEQGWMMGVDNTDNYFKIDTGVTNISGGVLTLSNTGFCGIGTDAPDARLHVIDNARITGDIYQDDVVRPFFSSTGSSAGWTITITMKKFDDTASANTRFLIHIWASTTAAGNPGKVSVATIADLTAGTRLDPTVTTAWSPETTLDTVLTDSAGKITFQITTTGVGAPTSDQYINVEVQGIVYSQVYAVDTGLG